MKGSLTKKLALAGTIAVGLLHSALGATVTVTSTTDVADGATSSISGLMADPGPDGVISLREAILAANNTAGTDTIAFAIPGAGLQSITPVTTLPTVTDPVVIDGYTQPGAHANTLAVGDDSLHLIELNGNGANFLALTITGGTSTVRGLVINRFNGNGPTNAITFRIKGGNTVEGCFLGVSADGTAAATNRDYGVLVDGSPGNVIGGTSPAARNVIAGNSTGIQINDPASSGTIIQGNYIGTNAAGTAKIGGTTGVSIGFNGDGTGSSNNQIGGAAAGAGNVISGLTSAGISIFDGLTTGNSIQGNLIGTNAGGTATLGGSGTGIDFTRTNNVLIGGTTVGAGNVISGNGGTGLNLIGDNNVVQGNLIGTDITGLIAVPNVAGSGIRLNGSNNLIGGSVPGARNVISGQNGNGLRFDLVGTTTGNLIQGNYFGTDITGTAALPNGGSGLQVFAFTQPTVGGVNLIGGNTAAARNIISGNKDSGISGGANNVVIQGNFIGSSADGTAPLGNENYGLNVGGVDGTTIGGTNAGEGNLIAFNGKDGVRISSVSSDGVVSGVANPILGNTIAANGRLGINLSNGVENSAGVTENDAGDADDGPNRLQNYPVLKSVMNLNGTVHLTGTLNSTPSTSFRLEFFRNDEIDPTGFGEGGAMLGFTNVTTDASGDAMFDVTFPSATRALRVTSTATDPSGNTSEFSAAIGQLLNISTRLRVETGDAVLIGGFIVAGSEPKRVIVRAIGPSLADIAEPLADPTLELVDANGTTIDTNDDWQSDHQAEIEATGIPPSDPAEAAIIATLPPDAAYTAIVRGKNDTTGVGVVEAYDLDDAANSQFANIATRGPVQTGNNVLIGGFFVGEGVAKVIVRALGPSLASAGVAGTLADPALELRDSTGGLIASNNDWQETQKTAIEATGIAPTDTRESALLISLAPGGYTAVVRGANGATGVSLVEVYRLNP